MGLPWWLSGKKSSCNAGDTGDRGLFLGSGRSPGEGHGNTLQYSCLENPMDRGAWNSTAHKIAKRGTRLTWLSTLAWKHYNYPKFTKSLILIMCYLMLSSNLMVTHIRIGSIQGENKKKRGHKSKDDITGKDRESKGRRLRKRIQGRNSKKKQEKKWRHIKDVTNARHYVTSVYLLYLILILALWIRYICLHFKNGEAITEIKYANIWKGRREGKRKEEKREFKNGIEEGRKGGREGS